MATPLRPPLSVRDELRLPEAPTQEGSVSTSWMRNFLTTLHQAFRIHVHHFPAVAVGEVSVNAYTNATRPAATTVKPGSIIFVSDGGAGAVFQGSTGAAWVNLG